MTAKVLVASTCRWFSTARLVMAFARAGCTVEVLCPAAGHPVSSLRTVPALYPYNALAPIRSFRAALLQFGPAIVIPADELAMRHLHHLYAIARRLNDADSKSLCDLITRSLGDATGYPLTESRDRFMAMIHREGIRAPETKTVASEQELKVWLDQFGLPAVVKADGTSGGEGVKIVATAPEALHAYRTLRAPLATVIAAKRTLFDHDLTCVLPWLAQRRRSVSIQSFISGPDANLAAACWQGEILASVSVEVLETWRPKGPATLVRLIENAGMSRAAETIVRRLKFSGLCGIDFLLEKTTGDAYLIELNSRATQTCPLALGHGRDLIVSLCTKIKEKLESSEQLQATGKVDPASAIELAGGKIALFPLAWQGDTSSETFTAAYHDIPWEEPQLVRLGLEQIKNQPRDKWIRWFSKMGLYHP